jgi:hypothetical protein
VARQHPPEVRLPRQQAAGDDREYHARKGTPVGVGNQMVHRAGRPSSAR